MSYLDALQHHIQRMVLADFCLSWDDVQWDDDGDISFRNQEGRVVVICLHQQASTTWARVYVEAAHGLKRSAKLLREVNELNVSLLGARALLTPDGRLIIAAEVKAESLEPGELGDMVDVVSTHAERSGNLIQLMFGEPGSGERSNEGAEP